MLGDATVTLAASALLDHDGATEAAAHAQEAAKLAHEVVGGGDRPDLDAAVAVALTLGRTLPLPGDGDTLARWSALATLGAADLTLARVVEPHVDALAILAEAAERGAAPRVPGVSTVSEALWGVYAAESPGDRLSAERTDDGTWLLTGTKPWCSLADRVDCALATAWVDDDRRALFAVRLDDEGVTPGSGPPWVSRGLADVVSGALRLRDVPGEPCGDPGWYLRRPGFAWGGVGVAAVWYGGAVGLARRLLAVDRRPDQVADLHIGAVDVALHRARLALADAARLADTSCSPEQAEVAATRTRQVVADAVEEVLTHVGHGLGPGPLTSEEEHARRVADLTVYLRQHHAERDLAHGGASVRDLDPDVRGW